MPQILHPNDQRGQEVLFRAKPRVSTASYRDDYNLVVNHLHDVERWFTESLREEMLKRADAIREAMEGRGYDRGRAFLDRAIPFRINVDDAISSLTPAQIEYKAELIRRGNKGLHKNQIRTLIATMIESSLELTKPGCVVGGMQSGKTGIALAIALFFAPLMYQLAGVKFFPLFLSTHLDSHAAQTEDEFHAVLELYGDVIIEVADKSMTPAEYYSLINVFEQHYDHSTFQTVDRVDPSYEQYPTPASYRNIVLRDRNRERAADNIRIIYNRRNGRETALLRERMQTLTNAGFSLLLLIDEPQFGASGEIVDTGRIDTFGRPKYSGNVIKQCMIDVLDDLLLEDGKHMAILFSATPFDTANMVDVWTARASLSPNYVGYNCWDGDKLDPDVWVRPPTLHSFTEASVEAGDADIENLRGLLGAVKKNRSPNYPVAKRAFLNLFEYLRNQRPVIAEETAEDRPDLRERLDQMVAGVGGLCVRFVNDNTTTDEIITNLELERYFQVFRYYGGALVDQNSRQVLPAEAVLDRYWNRDDPRPPMFVVTNLARMGDNFPRMIEMFLDFSDSAADLNSLLQGLNGRACGESKFLSQVVLSERSVEDLREYIDTLGLPIRRGSRHSMIVDGVVRRGRGSKMARVGMVGGQASDPVVQEFIRQINQQIVFPRFSDENGNRLKIGKLPNLGTPFYDLGSIINAVRDDQGRDFFEYLSDPAVQNRLFPHLPTMRIVDPRDQAATISHKDRQIGFVYEGDTIKVSFRSRHTGDLDAGHYGITDREDRRRPQSSQTDRAITEGALEIQINVLKRVSMAPNAPEAAKGKPGYPEAYMVTLPLYAEVRPRPVIEGRPQTKAIRSNWVAGLATDQEQAGWAVAEAAAEARRAARRRRASA